MVTDFDNLYDSTPVTLLEGTKFTGWDTLKEYKVSMLERLSGWLADANYSLLKPNLSGYYQVSIPRGEEKSLIDDIRGRASTIGAGTTSVSAPTSGYGDYVLLGSNSNSSSNSNTSSNTSSRTTIQGRYLNNEQKRFVLELSQAYRDAGVTNEDLITQLVAKNALETGYGKHVVGSYNYGNIKDFGNHSGSVRAHDEVEGSNDLYRSYATTSDFVKAELDLLRNRYDLTDDQTIDDFTSKLTGNNTSKRKYATGQDYARRVKGVYRDIKNMQS